MELNIGDKVKLRSRKDLYNEYGNQHEPYDHELGVDFCHIGHTGKVSEHGEYKGNPTVGISFYNEANDVIDYWWYYPEMLIKV